VKNYHYFLASTEFAKAKRIEEAVIRYYQSLGHHVRSARKDEEYTDIDVIVEDFLTISVKNQQAALRTGNLAFEVSDNNKDSWFITGKPRVYAICWGEKVRFFDAFQLKQLVYLLESKGLTQRKRISCQQNRKNYIPRKTINLIVAISHLQGIILNEIDIKNYLPHMRQGFLFEDFDNVPEETLPIQDEWYKLMQRDDGTFYLRTQKGKELPMNCAGKALNELKKEIRWYDEIISDTDEDEEWVRIREELQQQASFLVQAIRLYREFSSQKEDGANDEDL
jgi:hypothetical protein